MRLRDEFMVKMGVVHAKNNDQAPETPDELPEGQLEELIELKVDQVSDTALSQIKRQKYPDRLEHYKGNILLVGVNYDKEARNDDPDFKHHSCVIEPA